MSVKKAGAAAEQRRWGQALEIFEKAIKAVDKKDHERAKGHLENLASSFADQKEIVERSRVYLAVCETELRRKGGSKPKGIEELLAFGVFHHNREEYPEALKCFRKAADQAPESVSAFYCLAATAACSGDNEAAVEALGTAFGMSGDARAQARLDPDFEGLREEPDFIALMQAESE